MDFLTRDFIADFWSQPYEIDKITGKIVRGENLLHFSLRKQLSSDKIFNGKMLSCNKHNSICIIFHIYFHNIIFKREIVCVLNMNWYTTKALFNYLIIKTTGISNNITFIFFIWSCSKYKHWNIRYNGPSQTIRNTNIYSAKSKSKSIIFTIKRFYYRVHGIYYIFIFKLIFEINFFKNMLKIF